MITNGLLSGFNWENLVTEISQGNFIPVIGNEMYKYEKNGELVSVDEYLSQKLFEACNRTADNPLTLAETINFLEKAENLDPSENGVKILLKGIVESIDFNFPILNNLLSIEPLKFFSTSTVYSAILEKLIKEKRGQDTTYIDFSLRSPFSGSVDFKALQNPTLFNVFGSFNSVDPALREEEMLEFTASFKEKMLEYGSSILYAFTNQRLVFLGCSYPDWLTRFFLRVLTNERMDAWAKRPSKIILVNDQNNNRQKQYAFFKNYKAITYDGNTNEFVQELQKNWALKKPNEKKPKKVFISYSHKDAESASRLYENLSKIKYVECWFDKIKLAPGDPYPKEILAEIQSADLFIPLISQNCINEDFPYVKKEWLTAYNENIVRQRAGKKEKYLFPIIIDQADPRDKTVNEYFSYNEYTIPSVPGGVPGDDILTFFKRDLNLTA